MNSGILSTQLEKLPASGLTIELNCVNIFRGGFGLGDGLGLAAGLSLVYLVFFLLLLAALYLLPLALWQFLFLAAFLIWYCQRLFRKHFLLNHPSSIKKLVFTELGWCYVELNNFHIFKADIDPDTILSEYLVVLNLTKRVSMSLGDPSENLFFSAIKNLRFFNHYSVLLTADRTGRNKFRELKRHLRLISFSKNPV